MFFKDDHIDKCTIFNKFLVDDLKPYRIYGSSSDIYIEYKPDNINTSVFLETKSSATVFDDTSKIIINSVALDSFIKSSISPAQENIKDTWFPIFVNNSNFIDNKPIFNGVAISNPRIGIENFIKFPAFFQNWTNNGGPVTMSIDWILNSSSSPVDAIYGLLCWIKFPAPSVFQNITKFPKNSRLLGNDTKEYIKINDDLVFEINTDSSEFTNTNISFNDTNSIKSIASLSPRQPILFKMKQEVKDYWIPEGDFFAYFDNDEDKTKAYTQKISSRSYISPTLYNKYTQIYHILTLKEVKQLNSGRHLRRSRLLKRLSYILATSPFFNDGVTHNFLYSSHIETLVNNYLDQNINSAEEEITGIRNIVFAISQHFTQININNTFNQKNLYINYVNNSIDLFKKLLNKYGASIFIKDTPLSLTYKDPLIYGDDIFINQGINSYFDKKTPSGKIIYNNQKIELNEVVIDTKMNNQFSEIILSGKATDKPKILPCLDIMKPLPNEMSFSVGNDQIERYSIGDGSSSEVAFDIQGIVDIYSGDPSFDRYISYYWELIDGPCLRFGDFTRDKYRVQRFSYSNDSNPKIYVYKRGIYKIKCSISTDFGDVFDTKTIYVIDDTGTYDGINRPPPINGDPKLKKFVRITPNRIMCPNLNQVLINKRGLFWPIRTDLYIGKENNQTIDFIKLQGLNKFTFTVDNQHVGHQNSTLKLVYTPNNTTIKLNRIILKNIRNGSEECSQCMSNYQDLLTASPPTYARALRSPDSIILPRYRGQSKLNNIEFVYPTISTDFAPPIKSYGGYDSSIFSSIPISGLRNVNLNTNYPPITGHKLDYDKKICFEKESSNYNKDIIIGQKGIFHPSSGFILQNNVPTDLKNQSSVLNFNPGARSSFNFIGAGFDKLVSSHDNEGNNKANIFSSAISLNIDARIIPDPPPKNLSFIDSVREKELAEWKDGNEKKELPDHDVNHGYRSLDEGFNIHSDEFGYDASFLQKTDPSCGGPSVTYTFKSLGPKKIQAAAPSPGTLSLQNTIIPGMKIGDIEVKLNFLNYINTKNLVVWLDVNVSDEVNAKLFRTITGKPDYACQINGDTISPDSKYSKYCNDPDNSIRTIIPNTGLAQYMIDLINMNYVASTEEYIHEDPPEGQETPTVPGQLSHRSTIRLYLLNQEHIQNNTYNFSIKFSDHHSQQNSAHNINIASGNAICDQSIITNNMTLYPTTMASGYNDIQHMEYLSILKKQPISFTNNIFEKFKGLGLFGGAETASSSTTFTLNIAVLDEHDNMALYDNLIGSDMLTGYATSINKEQSNNIVNSLCNWELILHSDPDTNAYEDRRDFLGLINYKAFVSNHGYPGYNYLIDLENQIHLLPKANHNAPFNFINNTSLCKYPKFELSQNPLYRTVRFPTEVFIQIMTTAYAATLGGLSGGLAGVLIGAAANDPGYKTIADYFKTVRNTENINDINTFTDRADYSRYSFGSSDKILLNVSKDGIVWYKLEASIFKYKNSPPLKPNRFSYINCSNKGVTEPSKLMGPLYECSQVKAEDLWDKETIKQLKTSPKFSQKYIYPFKKNEYTLKAAPFDEFDDSKYTRFIVEGRGLYDILCIPDFKNLILFNNTSIQYIEIVGSPYLIQKNDRYYTVLNFLKDAVTIVNPTKIALAQGMILFKNNEIKSNPSIISKEYFNNTIPLDTFSVMGAGTYGQASAFVRPDILTNNNIDNTLKNISEISRQCTLTFNNTTKILGHIYTIPVDENKSIFYNNVLGTDTIQDLNLINSIKNSIIDVSENNSIYYIPTNPPNVAGYVSISEDLTLNNPIEYFNQNDINKIYTRINYLESNGTPEVIAGIGQKINTNAIINNGSIKNLQDHYNSISDQDPTICFDKNNNDNRTCYKKLIKQAIYDRYDERNRLIKALEESATKNALPNGTPLYIAKPNALNIVPYFKFKLIENTTNKTLNIIKEEVNNYKYWINIDPKQVCSRAYDVGPKILKSIRYTCRANAGGIIDLNSDNICPYYQQIPDTPTFNNNPIDNNVPMMFTKKGNIFTYTTPNRSVLAQKRAFTTVTKWTEYPITREFLINSGDLTDTKVDVYEIYLVPEDDTPIKDDYSSISNRVCSIFNLNDIDNLQIKIRNIPRKLKGIDNHYDKYIPGSDGSLNKSKIPSDGGPVWTNPKFWHCLYVDPNYPNNPNNFKFTDTTPYLQLQNEMIFRAFYNSVDGIEHKQEILDSLYPWEWIPYEYFTKPPE